MSSGVGTPSAIPTINPIPLMDCNAQDKSTQRTSKESAFGFEDLLDDKSLKNNHNPKTGRTKMCDSKYALQASMSSGKGTSKQYLRLSVRSTTSLVNKPCQMIH